MYWQSLFQWHAAGIGVQGPRWRNRQVGLLLQILGVDADRHLHHNVNFMEEGDGLINLGVVCCREYVRVIAILTDALFCHN